MDYLADRDELRG